MFEVFENTESKVRSYCRKYPVEFNKAKNAELFSVDGERYIDFLAVAGSMNYGHNNPEIKAKIMEYLSEDNVINALDMYTAAKEEFLVTFNEKILKPRQLDYKVMCCGPTGTNAVEAALKLARKNTQRSGVIAFSGAFHGMTLGSLAMTTDRTSRGGAGVPLANVTFAPYDGTLDSIAYLKWILEDDHSGVEKPAAIFLETIQAEGGINVASIEWLKEIRKICTEQDILMVCDEIQVGNGRTGHFFSFERAGIQPDMVVVSKSISGFGMPMALLLIRPDLDIFRPAEHNGTFRGNQLSFVGGTAGINYFVEHQVDTMVQEKAKIVEQFIKEEILPLDSRLSYRGMGLLWGIDFGKINPELALDAVHECFDRHMIIEVAGRKDCVLKLMPPLTISEDTLKEGLAIIKEAVTAILKKNN
ncbi:MAG: diaminobutyrate--2-oxoglutarate transaminase [Clostridia bacterium]|nr:diaminobutyrate--2-oxoglutarate transaminase [Lachnospiraceae bacterium]NCC00064.1 diaminobutyrate--2-oxoglutarate transaminase [Clostridia bacterium]NCD01908.1 diaminobutyrate--2-oxoglutarate transaminase [Clostridia bacterium]